MTLVAPDLAASVLERALARGGDFAELYAEARRGFALSLDDGRVERPQGGRERGVEEAGNRPRAAESPVAREPDRSCGGRNQKKAVTGAIHGDRNCEDRDAERC